MTNASIYKDSKRPLDADHAVGVVPSKGTLFKNKYEREYFIFDHIKHYVYVLCAYVKNYYNFELF